VWVAVSTPPSVFGVDPTFTKPKGTFNTGGNPGELTQTGTTVWVTDSQSQMLYSVDIASGRVTPHAVGCTPARITWSGSYVWVACDVPNQLLRLG
jgi:DNA-binding beta-propeller fold protein YncE